MVSGITSGLVGTPELKLETLQFMPGIKNLNLNFKQKWQFMPGIKNLNLNFKQKWQNIFSKLIF
jgi:hypothetical protein